MKKNIVVIDLHLGNILSLRSAIEFLGMSCVVSSSKSDLDKATHIILPGVGAFDTAMEKIKEFDLFNSIKFNSMEKRKPLLGICLGMQIMFQRSDEGHLPGLGIFKSELIKLKSNPNQQIKIPHVGFNSIYSHSDSGIFSGIKNLSYFYFTHSFGLVNCKDRMNKSYTNYGTEFVSGFQLDNISGVQFHPEKSQSTGLKLIYNFLQS